MPAETGLVVLCLSGLLVLVFAFASCGVSVLPG